MRRLRIFAMSQNQSVEVTHIERHEHAKRNE
jgi:hypothetical protein